MSQIYEPRFLFRIKQMNLSVENSNLFPLSEFPMVDYYIETLDELKGIIDLFSTCSWKSKVRVAFMHEEFPNKFEAKRTRPWIKY